jgi:hypothetical protein
MANPEVLTNTIINWAARRSNEVVFHPADGYYSLDIVLDAWKNGHEIGQEQFVKEVEDKHTNNAKLTTEALKTILETCTNKAFYPKKVFINISIMASSILISFDEEIYISDDFITTANSEASKIKLDYFEKGLNLQIGFLNDNARLNIPLLKSDGFGFAYDFCTKTIIE